MWRNVLFACALLATGCESLWMNHGKVRGCPALDDATSFEVAFIDEEPPPVEPGCQF